MGLSVGVNGSTDLSTPVAGLNVGVDLVLGGYFDNNLGWNLALGMSALGAYVQPARAPTGTIPTTSTYTGRVPAEFGYGAGSQLSMHLLFPVPNPFGGYVGIGPVMGFLSQKEIETVEKVTNGSATGVSFIG